jgi:hypothetical protein
MGGQEPPPTVGRSTGFVPTGSGMLVGVIVVVVIAALSILVAAGCLWRARLRRPHSKDTANNQIALTAQGVQRPTSGTNS